MWRNNNITAYIFIKASSSEKNLLTSSTYLFQFLRLRFRASLAALRGLPLPLAALRGLPLLGFLLYAIYLSLYPCFPPTALLTRTIPSCSSTRLVGFPSIMSPFNLRIIIKKNNSVSDNEPFSVIRHSDVDENCSNDQKPEFHPDKYLDNNYYSILNPRLYSKGQPRSGYTPESSSLTSTSSRSKGDLSHIYVECGLIKNFCLVEIKYNVHLAYMIFSINYMPIQSLLELTSILFRKTFSKS